MSNFFRYVANKELGHFVDFIFEFYFFQLESSCVNAREALGIIFLCLFLFFVFYFFLLNFNLDVFIVEFHIFLDMVAQVAKHVDEIGRWEEDELTRDELLEVTVVDEACVGDRTIHLLLIPIFDFTLDKR